MSMVGLLHTYLRKACPHIHANRLASLMDVTQGLLRSQELSLTSIARRLDGTSRHKHKIKKVDRLVGNTQLHAECGELYRSLSQLLLAKHNANVAIPLIIDLCFLQDDKAIQMLSAQMVNRKRSLALYEEVFPAGQLKGRAQSFLANLAACLPDKQQVIIILDAGFFQDWYQAIEQRGWFFVARVREGKTVFLAKTQCWYKYRALLKCASDKTQCLGQALLTKRHRQTVRLVTTKHRLQGRKRLTKQKTNYHRANTDSYSRGYREPWVLATNLPASFAACAIVSLYAKRMQIEESFRDSKSHRFGLAARYIRSHNVQRWRVLMLLAAMVKLILWLIGAYGKHVGAQRYFQANTYKNKTLFSNMFLGKLLLFHQPIPLPFRQIWRSLHNFIHEENVCF